MVRIVLLVLCLAFCAQKAQAQPFKVETIAESGPLTLGTNPLVVTLKPANKAVIADLSKGVPYFDACGKQCGWYCYASKEYQPYDRATDTFGRACPPPANAYAKEVQGPQATYYFGSCPNGQCGRR